jgi:hypothetical protein
MARIGSLRAFGIGALAVVLGAGCSLDADDDAFDDRSVADPVKGGNGKGKGTPGGGGGTDPVAPTDPTPPGDGDPGDPGDPGATPPPEGDPPPAVKTAGMWVSPAELAGLPMSGTAWSRVKSTADGSLGTANISDQDSGHDVRTYAVALVYARTGDAAYRAKAKSAIAAAIGTEAGGRTLALGRNLLGYVLSAELIDLASYDKALDGQFRTWLAAVRTKNLDGRTLVSTHEDRPNNWGTHAGASRIAASIYLGDAADVARAAKVFKGFLGDRASYAGFKYGDLSWQCDASKPVGINPVGCTKNGHPIGGVIPDDQRRGGTFTWPAPKENYVWEALQGVVVQAELLRRQGYDAWSWESQAIRRAVAWLHDVNSYPAEGDDTWQPWIVNFAYGTKFPAPAARSGKNMGFTDWTHAR